MNARRLPLAGAIAAGLLAYAGGSLYASFEPNGPDGAEPASKGDQQGAEVRPLSEQQLSELRRDVLRRCALSSRVDQNKLPWYFHYEFGVALLDAGDAERSLEELQIGANLREEPMRDKRMYGMWFIDYLPYFQIARAHSKLGEWDKASAALQLSDELERISRGDYDFRQYSELRQRIEDQSGLEHVD